MQGQVCLITGATSGLGRATARELGRRGATLILVGRNAARGNAVAAAIARSNPKVEFIAADLSSLDRVRALTRSVRAQCLEQLIVQGRQLVEPSRYHAPLLAG